MIQQQWSNTEGGGVAIYVRKNINCTQVLSKYLSLDNILECITVELMIVNQKYILVSCIYRKPASITDMFCEGIECIFGNVHNNKTMFLCGDFNINILKHDSHSGTKHLVDTMYSLTLYPLINKPTRVTR